MAASMSHCPSVCGLSQFGPGGRLPNFSLLAHIFSGATWWHWKFFLGAAGEQKHFRWIFERRTLAILLLSAHRKLKKVHGPGAPGKQQAKIQQKSDRPGRLGNCVNGCDRRFSGGIRALNHRDGIISLRSICLSPSELDSVPTRFSRV